MACRHRVRCPGAVMLATWLALLTTCTESDRESLRPPTPKGAIPAPAGLLGAGRVPMPTDYFVENVGQVANGEVLYYHRAGGIDIGFGEGSIWLRMLEPVETDPGQGPGLASSHFTKDFRAGLAGGNSSPRRGVALRLRFDGSNPTLPEVRREMPFRTNYLLGADPSGHRSGIRAYEEIVYTDLYDGIDLVLRPDTRGLKYELHLRPGASLESLALTYEGIEGLELSAEGEVVLHTALGDLRDAAPISRDGRGVALDCAFALRGPRAYGFVCPGWGGTTPLVIDPLIQGTYLGGDDTDRGYGIAVDASGNAYVAGETRSPDFPTPGGFDTSYARGDAFVAKIDPTGATLLYGTYVGGRDVDRGFRIAVDASGNAYVAGHTYSDDFPTPNGFDTTYAGHSFFRGGDAFVAKIDPTGATLLYGTYLGGGDYDIAFGLDVDASGYAYVTGQTQSTDFPTPNGFDTVRNGDDAFVAKIDPTGGTLLYGTFLGGRAFDQGLGIAVDLSGSAYVTGVTDSVDFPTPGGFDTLHNGLADAFIAKIDPAGGSVLYGTFLGGSDNEVAEGIAVDDSGSAYVTGQTESDDFPTPGGFDTTLGAWQDGFVAKIDPTGGSLLYGTYLGGSHYDQGWGIAVDASGNAYITGVTHSDDFPTPGGFDTLRGGEEDAFVAKVDPTGGTLLYGTYLGGENYDSGEGITLDASGDAYVVGWTESMDLLPPGNKLGEGIRAWSGADAFVARLRLARSPCPPPDDPMRLRRMDTLGRVEGVDPDFDETMLTDLAFPFNNLGFGQPDLGDFPDFGGHVVKLYFEFPDGVSEFSALTIYDRNNPSLPAGDPCSCFVSDAGADIFTGPDIHAVQAWDGGTELYPDDAPIFHPGERRFSSNYFSQRLTDNQYGTEGGDRECPTYNHIYGMDAGVFARHTAGLAGLAVDLVGAPNPDGVGVGHLFEDHLYDGAGNVIGPLDCSGLGGNPDRAYAPVYPDPAPGGKKAWPGFVSLGCGGAITVNFPAPAKPKTGAGTAGADIVIYALAGFDAALDGPLAMVGSSTRVGPVNNSNLGGLDCAPQRGERGTTDTVTITLQNDSEDFFQNPDSPPYGFNFENYSVLVVEPHEEGEVEGVDYFADQEESGTNLPPDPGADAVTVGPFNISCRSVFYVYAFGDDDSSGNSDGDGHPEQIFASDMDVTGVGFLGYTGIRTEPTVHDPSLLGVGRAIPVPEGYREGSVLLYAFSTGTPVGSVRVESAARVRILPRTLNRKSHGKWVTLDVRTKGGFKATDIDPATVVVEGLERGVSVPAMHPSVASRRSLKLKVPRRSLAAILEPGDEVLVTVRGLTFSGEEWSAQDVIRVIH